MTSGKDIDAGDEPFATLATRLSDEIQEAVALLQAAAYGAPPDVVEPIGHETLLQQCLTLCTQEQTQPPEPIRTIHHFACSGGTLISKCIAALPNVQLLSEVDPLSEFGAGAAKPRFAPTDMVTLLRQSSRGVDRALTLELFRRDLRLVHEETLLRGQRLVLRDHAHGHFCGGEEVSARPSLREIVADVAPVKSVLTVRHPVDSFVSLIKNDWVHFRPGTLDEYCRRYLAFLEAYEGVRIIRYEDFVSAPAPALQQICGELALPFSADFEQTFPAFKLTGDSGRSSNTIKPMARRPEAVAVLADSAHSEPLQALAARLGYTSGSE